MKVPKTKYIGVFNIDRYDNHKIKVEEKEYFEQDEDTKDDIKLIFDSIDNSIKLTNPFTYDNLYKYMTIYGVVYIYDWEDIIYGFGDNKIGIQLALLDYFSKSKIYSNMEGLIGE